MTLTWYKISLVNGENTYEGYFKVDESGNVLGYYDGGNYTTNKLGGSVAGFIASNTFNTTNITFPNYNSAIIVTSVLLKTLYNATNSFFAFTMNQIFDPPVLIEQNRVYYSDGSKYEVITSIEQTTDPSCYNEGTKILCGIKNSDDSEYTDTYIPIENLRKGQMVKTYLHGYKKIMMIGKNTMINDPITRFGCMYVMKKTDTNGLIEDLMVTGGHSILVDDLGIHKKRNDRIMKRVVDGKHFLLAAVSSDFEKIQEIRPFTYYHLTLESDDPKRFYGIWANGILSESTCQKDFIAHKYIPLE